MKCEIKAGDTVYQVGTDCLIHEDKINKVIYSTDGVDFDERAIGKSIFLTREEAERYLASCWSRCRR